MKKFNSKHLIAGFVVGTMCLTTTVFGAANKKNIEADYNTKGVTINYRIINFPQNQKPFTVDDIMYVPLTFFAETLGYKVESYLDNYINIGGGDVGRYSTQSRLLKDAMDYAGVATPDKAVEVWSEGLKQRSAAIQYSVMTKELKDIYEKNLESGNANWVTGVSSPWVEENKITGKEKINSQTYIFHMKYNTATSAGEDEPFAVTLKIIKVDDFWRISEVKGDKISTVYTGFLHENED